MHPNTQHLLHRFEWPQARTTGCLRWDRNVDRPLPWARGMTSTHASIQWEGERLKATVQHKHRDGSLTTVLEALWETPAGQAPVLVRFEQLGQPQALCDKTAVNRFRGQTFLMNVAPSWGR